MNGTAPTWRSMAAGRRAAAWLLLAAVTLTAACGSAAAPAAPRTKSSSASAGASSAQTPAAPAPAAAAPAGRPVSINVGIPAYNMTLSTANLAQKDGYFAAGGLKATVTRLHGSSVVAAALTSGNLQFVVTGASPFLLELQRGFKFIGLAPVDAGFTSTLLVTPAWAKAHPLPANATLAQRIGVLKGARVAIEAITDTAIVGYLEKYAHLPKSSVALVKVNSQQAQFAGLQHGSVDAIITSPPPAFQLIQKGQAVLDLQLRDVPGWGTMPYDVAATTTAYAKAHPKVVAAFTGALERAVCDVATRSPSVLKYEDTVYPTTAPSVVKQTLDFIHMTPYQDFTTPDWKGLSNVLQLSGQLKAPYVPQDGVGYTNQYIPSAAGHSCSPGS
jgi:ABC-type nitrate/sulfonate/bicarbonate transport system substrate-binding protein